MSTNKTLLRNQLFVVFPTDKKAACLFAHFPSVFHYSYFSFFLRIFLYLCLFKTNLCFVCSFPWVFILLFCLFMPFLFCFFVVCFSQVFGQHLRKKKGEALPSSNHLSFLPNFCQFFLICPYLYFYFFIL